MSRLIYRYKCQRLIFPVLAANHTLGSASVRTAGHKTTAPVLQPLEMAIHVLVKKKKSCDSLALKSFSGALCIMQCFLVFIPRVECIFMTL